MRETWDQVKGVCPGEGTQEVEQAWGQPKGSGIRWGAET